MQDTPLKSQFTVQVADSITDIPENTWNHCLNSNHPFMLFNFLLSLEESGSAISETGWRAQHLVLYSGTNIVGTMPMYLKEHSAGEYVFDHGWADAFHRAGGRYYPKLQVSVPFTPATGPRLLISPNVDKPEIARKALILKAIEHCQNMGASSLHITFPTREEWNNFSELGMLKRTGIQFHWFNQGYENFEEFLSTFSSSKRKQIRKERRKAILNDIKISTLCGDSIKEHHWDSFYTFYKNTGQRKWGIPYLNRDFFSLLGNRMADQIILIVAERAGKPIGAALNFLGNNTLYGRNWGCIEDHKFLHFEVCYYQAIDFAITNKINKIEAGAQGGHKLSRGYIPTTTYSSHWIAHPGLRQAVSEYLTNEVTNVDREIKILEKHSPFKRV